MRYGKDKIWQFFTWRQGTWEEETKVEKKVSISLSSGWMSELSQGTLSSSFSPLFYVPGSSHAWLLLSLTDSAQISPPQRNLSAHPAEPSPSTPSFYSPYHLGLHSSDHSSVYLLIVTYPQPGFCPSISLRYN